MQREAHSVYIVGYLIPLQAILLFYEKVCVLYHRSKTTSTKCVYVKKLEEMQFTSFNINASQHSKKLKIFFLIFIESC